LWCCGGTNAGGGISTGTSAPLCSPWCCWNFSLISCASWLWWICTSIAPRSSIPRSLPVYSFSTSRSILSLVVSSSLFLSMTSFLASLRAFVANWAWSLHFCSSWCMLTVLNSSSSCRRDISASSLAIVALYVA